MIGRHSLVQTGHSVKIEVYSDDISIAREAAAVIAADARAAVPSRGRFIMAVSGDNRRRLAGDRLFIGMDFDLHALTCLN